MAVERLADNREIVSGEIAARLKGVRQELGLSQRAMAKRMEVSPTTYSSWELGRTAPNALSLNKLAEFGIDIHWFVTGEGDAKRRELGYLESQEQLSGASSHPTPSAQPQLDPTILETVQHLERAGLGEALLLSRRGRMDLKWLILKTMSDLPNPVTPHRVHDLIQPSKRGRVDLRDVQAEMTLLETEGLLIRNDSGFAVQNGAKLQSTLTEDFLQGIREVIAGLGREVVPSLLRRDGSGGVSIWEVTVGDTGAFLSEMRKTVRQLVKESSEEPGERVTVYLCAGTGPGKGT